MIRRQDAGEDIRGPEYVDLRETIWETVSAVRAGGRVPGTSSFDQSRIEKKMEELFDLHKRLRLK